MNRLAHRVVRRATCGWAAVAFAAAPVPAQQRSGEIVLATTTSTQDTGLLDSLLPMFRRETGIEVKPIAVGTGAALEMARRGDADAVLGFLDDRAELESVEPFPAHRVTGAQLRAVLADLCRTVRMDLTRKQLTRDLAAWTVRIGDTGTARSGRAQAVFRNGRLLRLRLGPAAE